MEENQLQHNLTAADCSWKYQINKGHNFVVKDAILTLKSIRQC
jgi:hypothetical protein